MNVKCCHLTSVHPRDDIRIFHKMCRGLKEEGLDISLICADGLGDSVNHGIQVLDTGKASRRVFRALFKPVQIFFKVKQLQPALVHLHDPELLIAGLFLKLSGITVIYDAHEDLPRQILSKSWIPAIFRRSLARFAESIENFIARRLSFVIAATPTIEHRFLAAGCHTSAVCNYPILSEFKQIESYRITGNIAYIGAISRVRGIFELVKTLELMPEKTLILAGKFESDEFRREVESLPGWHQVKYIGKVDRVGIAQVLSCVDLGLVTLWPIDNYKSSLPIKMFEYMAAGIPVLASDFPLWQEILRNSGAGETVDPLNVEAIAGKIVSMTKSSELKEVMGLAGRRFVSSSFHWGIEIEKLLGIYRAELNRESG